MKLEIDTTEALYTSTAIASFFVISLYMWIPCEKKDKNKKKEDYDENSNPELLKRITSVLLGSSYLFNR